MVPNSEIFRYADYRSFLRDYFVSQKKAIPGFSYRLFAQKAGFASPAFFKLVVDGKKNLSKESVLKLSRALGLNAKASDYFEDLVFFDQSKDIRNKSHFMDRLQKRRPKDDPARLLPPEYGYFCKWYYGVVREMVDLPDFDEDPQWISHKLNGRISAQEAGEAIRFLTANGFLSRKENGKLSKKSIASPGEPKDAKVAAAIAQHHQVEMTGLAREAIMKQPKDTRTSVNLSLCLSRRGYESALEKIARLRKELLEIAASDWIVDRVIHLNANLFQMTKNPDSERNRN